MAGSVSGSLLLIPGGIPCLLLVLEESFRGKVARFETEPFFLQGKVGWQKGQPSAPQLASYRSNEHRSRDGIWLRRLDSYVRRRR